MKSAILQLACLLLASATASAKPKPGIRVHNSANKVHPHLEEALITDDSPDVFVKMATSLDFEDYDFSAFSTRGERIAHVYELLKSHAQESQADLHSVLDKFGGHAARSTTWLANGVFLEDAEEDLIRELANRPDISIIEPQTIVTLVEPLGDYIENADVDHEPEWNVRRVRAPEVWAAGNTGQGITVGILDTGARFSHEALKGSYRGSLADGSYDHEYNFFVTSYSAPGDDNGHGTHCAGTSAGQNGIGIAPGAKWVAAQALNGMGSGTTKDLLAAAQWMLCPTKQDGTQPDCSKAPHIVSNSWGGGSSDSWFYDMVHGWKAAGIIPIFANGNSGPDCATVNSPGDYESVIGVGATNNQNVVSDFSSRGPSRGIKTNGPVIKPDISAPGQDIKSAWNQHDTSYNTISGTSMATPAVAGVVALLLAQKGDLTYDQIYTILTSTTAAMHGTVLPEPEKRNQECGELTFDVYPNNLYGHGIVDAAAAAIDLAPIPPALPECSEYGVTTCHKGKSNCGACSYKVLSMACVCESELDDADKTGDSGSSSADAINHDLDH